MTVTLARISLHLLSTPSHTFSELVTPLLSPATIPNTLIVILLDWKEPQLWLRQLLDWVLFLRSVMEKLDPDAWETMERVMTNWKRRRGDERTTGGAGVGGAARAATRTPTVDQAAMEEVALGPGEWEDALGLPLCVVCQNVSAPLSWYGLDRSIVMLTPKSHVGTIHGRVGNETLVEGSPF